MSSTTVGDRLEKLFPDDEKRAQVLAAFSDLPAEKGDRLLLGDDKALKIALETLLTAPAQESSYKVINIVESSGEVRETKVTGQATLDRLLKNYDGLVDTAHPLSGVIVNYAEVEEGGTYFTKPGGRITTLEGWQATADSRLEQGAASKGLELLLSSGHTCAEVSNRKRWTANGKSVAPDAVIIASSNDTNATERKATKGCVLVLEAKHKATAGAVVQLRRTMKFLRDNEAAFPEITGKRMLGALYSAFMDPRCSQDVTDLLKEGFEGECMALWTTGAGDVENKSPLYPHPDMSNTCCQASTVQGIISERARLLPTAFVGCSRPRGLPTRLPTPRLVLPAGPQRCAPVRMF